MEATGCEPIGELAKIAMDEKADLALRVKALSVLASFAYPKPAPIVEAGDGEPVQIEVVYVNQPRARA